MSTTAESLQPVAPSPEDKIRAWIGANLSASVHTIERLARWRPAWRVEASRNGSSMRLHVRGDRASGLETTPLRREHDVLVELGRRNIPVPRIHGWCEDPPAIVMEEVSGVAYEGGAD